ncbi:hypothetical protein ANCDUO_04745 [Ancylostoma duodenale]|uniref:Tc1-like transposase DDE domain-containing protein n=1 Tax=Ancylostoma duodenale TaxID=51022 RepID=A0A0C2H0A0_9BILA|nr:hypothetical protein ANCDUO_04745 [Ancylostoma duodenale]
MIRNVNKEAWLDFCLDKVGSNETFFDCVFTDESTVQGYAKLVQNNSPVHKSRYTTQKLASWGVNVLEWPPESPDLNPLELIWGNMKYFVRRKNVHNLNALREAVLEYWRSLTPEICSRYVNNIHRKMPRVVEKAGGNIYEGR